MKRVKDTTPHTCRICGEELTASGMPSHLYHKHDKINSNEYAAKYGEFRKKYLELNERKKESEIKCLECGTKVVSHKALMHHVNKKHSGWKDYIIKYMFNGKHPTCKCGCGEKVKLLRNGKDERGNVTYARSYITGHDTKTRRPGYRFNTRKQKDKMRKSAIKRMEAGLYNNGPSKGEIELQNFMKKLKIPFISNDRILLSGLEIDLLIPEHKIAIEFNGDYFHSDTFKKKRYHINKTKECEEKGYRLIHIWETDWYLKKEIIKSILKSILNKTSRKVYARNTLIREVSFSDAKTFLEDNHLQGSSVSKMRLGLYYGEELVSLMSFSNLRRATGLRSKEGCYELIRFCNKVDTVVIGGASKLFSNFTKKYKPKQVISYANRDWSVGNLYENLKMKFIKETSPGYFYTKSKYKFSRFQFQKHKLVSQGKDPSLTEYEIMREDGYSRVWDCGNLLYNWTR